MRKKKIIYAPLPTISVFFPIFEQKNLDHMVEVMNIYHQAFI